MCGTAARDRKDDINNIVLVALMCCLSDLRGPSGKHVVVISCVVCAMVSMVHMTIHGLDACGRDLSAVEVPTRGAWAGWGAGESYKNLIESFLRDLLDLNQAAVMDSREWSTIPTGVGETLRFSQHRL